MNLERVTTLRATRPLLGTWLSIGSPVVAELAAESGFDWVLFDLEHGCGSEASLFGNLQAIKGTGAAGVVRVGAPHPDLILRALDWGADGIMVPHIASAAEAEACAQAIHYPPRGRRGVSKTVRAYGYGLRPPAAAQPSPEPVLMVQIETLEGVEHAAEIAAVEGVDVLFVGPGDLAFDLQARQRGQPDDYLACLRAVVAAVNAQGKRAGILLRNGDDAAQYVQEGFTHLALESDLSILRNGYQALLNGRVPSRGNG